MGAGRRVEGTQKRPLFDAAKARALVDSEGRFPRSKAENADILACDVETRAIMVVSNEGFAHWAKAVMVSWRCSKLMNAGVSLIGIAA